MNITRKRSTGNLVLATLALTGALAIGQPSLAATETAIVEVPAQAPVPLVAAARDKDAAAVTALLAAKPKIDVNQRSPDGTSALHWAVYNDDVAMVDRLLAAGADVNASNDYQSTPLTEAAVIGNSTVLRKLLAAGAKVESLNADGQTALMILARSSNVDAAVYGYTSVVTSMPATRLESINDRTSGRSPMPLLPMLAKAFIIPITVPTRPIIGVHTPITER